MSQLDEINYLEEVGRICARVGQQPFSKDDAKNACSQHENCVGYMNKILEYFHYCGNLDSDACNHPLDEDKGVYDICFNNGKTSFISIPVVEGRENEKIKMYKKDDQGNDLKWG